MQITRLNIWNNDQIKNKISVCMTRTDHINSHRKETSFPLSEVLKTLYRSAIVPDDDFYTMKNLEKLFIIYNEGVEKKEFTISQLFEEGWITAMFGRWESSLCLHNWETVEVIDELYSDASILRFLIWLEEQSKNIPGMRILDPTSILNKWSGLYQNIPPVEWFEEQHYLIRKNDEWIAYRAYTYSSAVDEALAGLWAEWKEEDPAKWLRVARLLAGTDMIFEFLDEPNQKRLFYFFQDNYFMKCDVLNYKMADQNYYYLRMLEWPKYMMDPKKYTNAHLWTGNRVFDQADYRRFGFEHYRRYGVHQKDCSLILHPMLSFMKWGQDNDTAKFTSQLNRYDDICAFYTFFQYDNNLLYELLTTKGTMYIGFRELLQYKSKTAIDMDLFGKIVIEIMDKIISEGYKNSDFLDGRELGMCLLELMCRYKEGNEHSLFMLESIIDIIGMQQCMNLVNKDLQAYFLTLLETKNSVKWVSAFHLILLCMKRWFYKDTTRQKELYYKEFLDIIWRGYCKIFHERNEYVTFVEDGYWDAGLCYALYNNYVDGKSNRNKIQLLFPEGVLDESEESTEAYYYYSLLLKILFRIFEQRNCEDSFMKSVLVDVLRHILISEEHTKSLFDYTKMQIYSVEDIIGKCISILSFSDYDDRSLMEQLLQMDVPELLVFYYSAEDRKFKNQLQKQIDCKATVHSLDVFHDERAIDLVLDQEIASLYPAVNELIDRKLKAWKERGIKENQDFVKYTINQKWRLKFIQNDYNAILSGDSLFFKAIVYTDTQEHRDFAKADRIWRTLVEDTRNKQPSAIYLNYLFLLNQELDSKEEQEADHIAYVKEQFQWLVSRIESDEILHWSQENQEKFVWYVVQQKKRMGEDYLSEFYDRKKKYQLTMTADDFRDEKQQQIETENLSLQDKITEMDMVQLLQSFWSRNLDKKSRIYYLAQGIDEINEKNPGQLLLVDAIMTVCDALQNFASQLIYVDSSKTNKTNKLNEDYVTMLFREIFNHAFGKSIQLKVFDQEKRGATGTITNGRMSPAELDLLIHYGDESHEVIEAFVLTNQTSNTVFQDHVGKILGNNIKHEPLSFMLIYGNAMDSSKAFDKYRKYLSERALADFSNEGIQQMDLLDVTEAPYYINEFTHAHEGLELIRQRILFDDGRTQEVLHMYLDIAKMQETSIRKSTK